MSESPTRHASHSQSIAPALRAVVSYGAFALAFAFTCALVLGLVS